MEKMNCRISKRGDNWEGTVTINGLNRTKLVRISDGKTTYASRSGVVGAAKTLANRMGFELNLEDTTTKAKTQKAKPIQTLEQEIF